MIDQTTLEYVGYGAAALTTLAFLPQLVHTMRTGKTEGLNLAMYVTFIAGVSLWMVYGVAIDSVPMMVANTLTLIQAFIILSYKIRNDVLRSATQARQCGF
tara:strand:+ start:212 stop:514 length:303 start_codon:yes stop_codon:yes gene_type:complete